MDIITTEVIARRFTAASAEMFATLVRAAFSPNIRERRDCSTAIFGADGQLLALTAIGPIHLSSLMGVVERLGARYPLDEMAPGDCFVTNDPYTGGGSHLPDITLISPVILDGEVVAFAANLAHHSDIGGRVPGSESADCTEIFQEGLRIPIVRLARRGEVQREVFDFLTLNSRRPTDREGDVLAQLAANRLGVGRTEAIFDKFGHREVLASIDNFLRHAEQRARTAVRAIPDGHYQNVDYLDNDGIEDRSVPLVVTVTVAGDRLRFDFTGTGPQVAGARNMTLSATLAGVYYAVKALLDPELPANSGTYRAVEVDAPVGCVFNAQPPAAVGDRSATGNVLGDLIFGAMYHAIPHRVCAGCGPYQGITSSGVDPRNGQYFVDYETFAGASGATSSADGRDAVRVHTSGAANLPVESLEQEYPMAVLRYELVTDSGGPGRQRGGMGTRREVLLLGEPQELSGRGLRQVEGANGLDGGADGTTGRFELRSGNHAAAKLPGSFSSLAARTGDTIVIETPSGAGFGDPLDRAPEAVYHDLQDHRISEAAASDIYAVRLAEGKVDVRATEALRQARRAKGPVPDER